MLFHVVIASIGLVGLLSASAEAQSIEQRVKNLETELGDLKKSQISKGTIVFSQEATCPVGFIEFTALQGRYVVGRPAGGLLNAEVGKPLADKERRNTVAWHEHTINPVQLSHTHPIGTNRLGWAEGKYGAADGNNLPITEQPSSGQAVFAKGSQADPIKTDANGLTDSADVFVNAPYIQLLACVKG